MQIECKNLSIGYNRSPLHKGINFSIPTGSYVSIIGENGVGKSTLVKTLLGLIPALNGEIIFGVGLEKRNIGYLSQQNQVQKDFPASVFEVVMSGCINLKGRRPFYSKKEKEFAREVLEKLNISHLEKKSYSQLSGGQQQRTLLARALCANSNLLLLDEPTAGLDVAATNNFYQLIRELNEEGVTIIMVTHDLHENLDDVSHVVTVDNSGIEMKTNVEYINIIGEEECIHMKAAAKVASGEVESRILVQEGVRDNGSS